MATLAPHSHHVPRRESSPRSRDSSSSRRPSRPRLLRACATEPSITTSNSCSGVLTAPNTSQRATELLSRVAVSNSASENVLRLSPTYPTSTQGFNIETEDGAGHRLSETTKRVLLHDDSQQHSAYYFSFPSFDAWEQRTQQNEQEAL